MNSAKEEALVILFYRREACPVAEGTSCRAQGSVCKAERRARVLSSRAVLISFYPIASRRTSLNVGSVPHDRKGLSSPDVAVSFALCGSVPAVTSCPCPRVKWSGVCGDVTASLRPAGGP